MLTLTKISISLSLAINLHGQAMFFGGNGSVANVYLHTRSLTIDHTQAGATNSTNFPLLLQATEADWAVVGSGGTIQNTVNQTGGSYTSTIPADMIFTTDSGCTTPVAGWEFESYTTTTGALKVWINVATVSHTSDTVIYTCYDNASVSTQQMTTSATWNTNFVGVFHMPNGSALSGKDSSTQGNNGTLVNSPSAQTGQVDGAGGFLTSSRIDMGKTGFVSGNSARSVALWFNKNSASTNVLFGIGTAATNKMFGAFVLNTGVLTFWNDNADTATSLTVTQNGTVWYRLWVVYDGTVVHVYANGTDILDHTQSLSSTDLGGASIGGFAANTSLTGIEDEFQVIVTNVSADWITLDYNNQKASSTLITIGSET